MLLPDGGERLREVLALENHPRRWYELLPLYGDLQLASAPAVDGLVESGLPDFRLARLTELGEHLAEELGAQGPGRRHISALCAELAAFGLPETIQHDDLHDGNVFVRDGGYAIFDWGDSCAAHPFMSLVVCLRGIVHRFGLAERDPDLERLRDVYLAGWHPYGSRETLTRAAELAVPLGMLCRALTWWRVANGVDEPARSEYAEGAREWFDEVAAAATALTAL
jgi:Ser/Thr protein kinase RdoA (MazF antagonist)